MKNSNLNQPVTVTKKTVYFSVATMVILLIVSIIALCLSVSNSTQIKENYQVIAKNINTLEDTLGDSNTLTENMTALDESLKAYSLKLTGLGVDVENLKERVTDTEFDLVDVQSIVKKNDLDNVLTIMESRLSNVETDVDSIKSIQKTQQSQTDEIKSNLVEFKNQIVNKVTSLLSSKKNSDVKKKANVSPLNFKYQLSSIEYRSGEQWAVFSPSTLTSLSQLKFLTVGDVLDNWKVVQITHNSVQLVNNGQQFTMNIK